MRLVSDYSKYHLQLNGVELMIAPDKLAPFNVFAEVEEQDVALILSAARDIISADDKPSWYLSHKIESQKLHQPGSVLIRHETPLRLHAIVHDFDHDPSWKQEWIEKALENIIQLANEKEISSVKLPVLGAQHGRFDQYDFIRLLVKKLKATKNKRLTRIWLVIAAEDCDKVFESLKTAIN